MVIHLSREEEGDKNLTKVTEAVLWTVVWADVWADVWVVVRGHENDILLIEHSSAGSRFAN